ncbi:MAG: alkaline phosphatase D family protein [Planctomycetota bacterium]
MASQGRAYLAAVLVAAMVWAAAVRAQGVEHQWYKRAHRPCMKLMEQGDYGGAAEWCRAFLDRYPQDPEALYFLTAAYARLGRTSDAASAARRAVDAGLPAGRFYAGPRAWFGDLTQREDFAAAFGSTPAVVHGPMIGSVTENSARFWVRTSREAEVKAMVTPPLRLQGGLASPTVRSTAETNYTAVAEVTGLLPDTEYHYRVLVDGESIGVPRSRTFRTYPAGGGARFAVGFGGGAGYYPDRERVWARIAGRALSAFLFLGDNVYIDWPDSTPVQRYHYYRRQSRPEFRRLVGTTPVYAIWDDHDFARNDGWGGPKVEEPEWKRRVWRVFRQNWVNPSYGGGEERPGCWFRFSIADVDFFMLDGRYYRTDPRGESPSMLGPAQKRWLLDGLKASRATFKVMVTPVPMARGTKGRSPDTWDGYAEERRQIFDFLHEHRIEGVFTLAADRHRSDVWRIEREAGYDLYEFESSKLTNRHTHPTKEAALFSYNEKPSWGLLRFDTTRRDPRVTYEIVTIDGRKVHGFVLRRSRLSYDAEE